MGNSMSFHFIFNLNAKLVSKITHIAIFAMFHHSFKTRKGFQKIPNRKNQLEINKYGKLIVELLF